MLAQSAESLSQGHTGSSPPCPSNHLCNRSPDPEPGGKNGACRCPGLALGTSSLRGPAESLPERSVSGVVCLIVSLGYGQATIPVGSHVTSRTPNTNLTPVPIRSRDMGPASKPSRGGNGVGGGGTGERRREEQRHPQSRNTAVGLDRESPAGPLLSLRFAFLPGFREVGMSLE